jgi:hypothetical protein
MSDLQNPTQPIEPPAAPEAAAPAVPEAAAPAAPADAAPPVEPESVDADSDEESDEDTCCCGDDDDCCDEEYEYDEEDEGDVVGDTIDRAVEVARGLCEAALEGGRIQLHGVTPDEVGAELAAIFRATFEGILDVFVPGPVPEDDDE